MWDISFFKNNFKSGGKGHGGIRKEVKENIKSKISARNLEFCLEKKLEGRLFPNKLNEK